MYLTGKEILDIAGYAGFSIGMIPEEEKEIILESAYQLVEKNGKKYIFCDEYPGEGCLSLSETK